MVQPRFTTVTSMVSRRFMDKSQGEVQVSPVERDTAALLGSVTICMDSDDVRTKVAQPEQTKNNPTRSAVRFLIRMYISTSPQTGAREHVVY